MPKLLCWLGLHDWLVEYRTPAGADWAIAYSRECLRCPKEQAFNHHA